MCLSSSSQCKAHVFSNPVSPACQLPKMASKPKPLAISLEREAPSRRLTVNLLRPFKHRQKQSSYRPRIGSRQFADELLAEAPRTLKPF